MIRRHAVYNGRKIQKLATYCRSILLKPKNSKCESHNLLLQYCSNLNKKQLTLFSLDILMKTQNLQQRPKGGQIQNLLEIQKLKH